MAKPTLRVRHVGADVINGGGVIGSRCGGGGGGVVAATKRPALK